MKRESTHPLILRCAPGLARVLQLEMRFRKVMKRGMRATTLHQRNHDLLFLGGAPMSRAVAELRIAEESGVCYLFGRSKVSEKQLDRAAAELLEMQVPFRLAVTADGRHFDRRDMERYITRELKERGLRLSERAERQLWFFLVEENFYLVLQETHEDHAPFRNYRQKERSGSLPPAVAAAMAFTGSPQPGETVLDPVCGSGTLLAEAYGVQPSVGTLLGFDKDHEAVKVAQANLKRMKNAEVQTGDGAATGLAGGSVDLVLANLPFGKQFGDTAGNPVLYAALLKDMLRTARRGTWRAVLLTSDTGSLKNALKQFPSLKAEEAFTVKIRGEMSRVYVVKAG